MIWKAQHAFKYMLYTGCVLTPTHSVKTCYTIQSSQQQLLFWYIYVHKMLCFCIINSTKRAPSFSFSRISARWKPKHRLVQLTFISKEMEEGKKKKHPFLYLTHCVAPLAHQRCANEYFNKSKWILLLSQRCWHPLCSYRWSISAKHAPVARVMYQDLMGSLKVFVLLQMLLREGLTLIVVT